MKLKKALLLVLLIGLLVPFATANIAVSSNQDTGFSYNYQDLDDDNEDEVSVNFDIEIENNGVENESVTLSLTSNYADYNVAFASSSDEAFDLSVGESRTITVDITVDASNLQDQGNYSDVFDLIMTWDSGLSTTTASFDAEVENMFLLQEIFFEIDNKEEGNMQEDDSNDDRSDVDVTPGDEVTILFNIENLFDKDFDDGDLEFDITVELDDSDFGEDIDEDVDFTIDAGDEINEKDVEAAIEFEVPFDAEEGDDYELTILIEAKDESGAKYNEEWVANINVEREDEDVRIHKVSLANDQVQCSDATSLTIEVINFGSDKQDDFFLAIDGEELNVDDDVTFDLSYGHDTGDNDETVTFQINIPEDQAEDNYDITIRGFYEDGDLADSEQVEVTVVCPKKVEESNTEKQEDEEKSQDSEKDSDESVETITFEHTANNENDNNEVDSETEEVSGQKISTVEKSYSKTDVEFGLLVALILLAVIAIIVLLLAVMKHKK